MSDDGFDWHASELAKTNPNVEPPELPDGHAVAGEVEAKAEAPELVEISTVRVLGDLAGTRLEAPNVDGAADQAAERVALSPADTLAPVHSRRNRAMPLLLALALLILAAAAWALVG